MSLPAARQAHRGITASSAAAAIGVHPYQSRQQCWKLLTGRESFDGNEYTRWGDEHEKYAVAAYEAEFGVLVDNAGERQEFFRHPRYPWLGCTPDGFVGGLVEAKCPQAMYDAPRDYHIVQVQVSMAVCEQSRCDYLVWTPDEFHVWRIHRSLEFFSWMLPYLYAMWRCIRDDREPPRFKRGRKPIQPEVQIERLV